MQPAVHDGAAGCDADGCSRGVSLSRGLLSYSLTILLSYYLTVLPVGSTPCSMSALSTPGVASSARSTRALSGAASSAAPPSATPGAAAGGDASSSPSYKVVRTKDSQRVREKESKIVVSSKPLLQQLALLALDEELVEELGELLVGVVDE